MRNCNDRSSEYSYLSFADRELDLANGDCLGALVHDEWQIETRQEQPTHQA